MTGAVLSRSARGEINRLPCVYASALHNHSAVCGLSATQPLSGTSNQEQIVCTQPIARAHCAALFGHLKGKSQFAIASLKRDNPAATGWLRIQCGGLEGLRQILTPDASSADVHLLLEKAHVEYGSLEQLPYDRLMPAITHWKP